MPWNETRRELRRRGIISSAERPPEDDGNPFVATGAAGRAWRDGFETGWNGAPRVCNPYLHKKSRPWWDDGWAEGCDARARRRLEERR